MEYSSDEDDVAVQVAVQGESACEQVSVRNVDNSVVEDDSDSSFRGFSVEDIESVLYSDISEDEHEGD